MNRPASFDAQIMACRSSLRGNAMKLTKNADKADDLVQDTITKALATWETYHYDGHLLGWLFVMMRNIHFTNHRRHWRMTEDPEGIHASTLSVEATQEAPLHLQDVAIALTRVNPLYREALLMAADGVSYGDIAKAVGSNEGTIKSRVSRARSELQGWLA